MKLANSSEPVFLKPEVKLEPLMCRWSAWPHLIAPAQYAMNIFARHLEHLRDFIASPSVHIAASKDPAMLGGPFVCLTEGDVPRVHELIKHTINVASKLLTFAEE